MATLNANPTDTERKVSFSFSKIFVDGKHSESVEHTAKEMAEECNRGIASPTSISMDRELIERSKAAFFIVDFKEMPIPKGWYRVNRGSKMFVGAFTRIGEEEARGLGWTDKLFVTEKAASAMREGKFIAMGIYHTVIGLSLCGLEEMYGYGKVAMMEVRDLPVPKEDRLREDAADELNRLLRKGKVTKEEIKAAIEYTSIRRT